MISDETPDFQNLVGNWLDGVRAAQDRNPRLTAQAWQGNALEHVTGVGLRGRDLIPCVFVDKAESIPLGRRWANGSISGRCRVVTAPAPHIQPFRPENNWGGSIATDFVAGGLPVVRQDSSGQSGGTATIVLRRRAGGLGLLGCLHCLAPDNGTNADPEFLVLRRADTLEPVARVKSWMQVTSAFRQWRNSMDAGLAVVDANWLDRTRVGHVTRLGAVNGVTEALPGHRVIKNGATTGITEGRVASVVVSSRIAYGWPGAERQEFVVSGCTEVLNRDLRSGGRFSAPGDSGSPIIVPTPVGFDLAGIHFAGGDQRALFCPIRPVLDRFGLEIPAKN